ncbi:hypothetical protein AB3S75_015531 [Citrus x aurantiifolia]
MSEPQVWPNASCCCPSYLSMYEPAAESKLFICPKSFCHNDGILFAIGTDILEQLMGNNMMHLAIPMAHPFTIATAVTSTFAWHSESNPCLFAIYEQKDLGNWILSFNIRLLAVIMSIKREPKKKKTRTSS